MLDGRSGNAGLGATVRSVLVGAFNEYQDFSRRHLPALLRIRGGIRFPFLQGQQCKTPGDRGPPVFSSMCRSTRRGTLSAGPQYFFISGRTLHLRNPSIVLQDEICTSDFHRLCPRGSTPVGGEIWLERVEPGGHPSSAGSHTRSSAAAASRTP